MSEVSRTFATTASQDSSPAGSSDVNQQAKLHEGNSIPVPLTAIEKENGKPYAAQHFKLHDYNELMSRPELDIDGIVDKSKMIEQYVRDNIELRGLDDSTESFDFLLAEILLEIGDIPVEDIRHKFFRIAKYVEKNQDVKGKMERDEILSQLKELNNRIELLK